jgi:hypothetical protein
VAAGHGALAGLLLARGYAVAGGFELRIATSLDPGRASDVARLAQLIEADERGLASGASGSKP